MKRLETLFALCALALTAAPAVAKGPGAIKFDEATFEVAESAGQAVITVERSGGEDGAVTVHYATSDGTATAGQDYTAVSGTLSWAAGDESRKTFAVPILDDTVAEGVETIHLTLSSPTGGATVDAARGTSDLLILASDGGSGGGGGDDGGGDHGGSGAGTIKFDQSDFQVLENAGQAVVTVEREHGEHGAVTVHYATSDGTATAGQDYTATAGTLSWADGDESRKVILIPIVNDSIVEGSEAVHLTLSAPTGGAALDGERSSAVLTILEGGRNGDDDDNGNHPGQPGTIKFDERSFQVIESAGVARIAVERSGGDHGVVSVRFQTADGSAKAGEDYSAVSTILTWGNGDESRKIVEVPITNDAATEGNETVLLSLVDPTGGATVDATRGSATLTILDDDGSTSSCVEDDRTLCLAGGRFKVEIVWRTSQGLIGAGHGSRLSGSSATFWFFDPSNAEMLIKVLDACNGFNAFWVYFAATTDVDFTATVTDTRTGIVKQYTNPSGRAAMPVQDTSTFATCGR
ncbi:MAG: hypothetical protein JF614_02445 [Acidobacteria bacterium]|nr:hypothetical protein [Acidobacteriota bacterium]